VNNESFCRCFYVTNPKQSDLDGMLKCSDYTAISATQHLKPMRGCSQSQLMLGADAHCWVVKFRNNPQHARILANEHIVSGIARLIGLSVPPTALIYVSPGLVEISKGLSIQCYHWKPIPCASGPQFGSQYAGGLMPSFVLDCLPDDGLQRVINLPEFLGMLALDKWTGNTDDRQTVFVRTQRRASYKALFIDFGHCFNGGFWTFPDSPLAGVYGDTSVYANVTGWDSFEPWLSRLEYLSIDMIWRLSKTMPEAWYEGNANALEKLICTLDNRKGSIRRLIQEYRDSDAAPFPKWPARSKRHWPARSMVSEWLDPPVVPIGCGPLHLLRSHSEFSLTLP
jgi:hypothetical protein